MFPTWPDFSEDQVAAVSQVMRSGKVNYWTGTQGREFEKAFSEYCGTEHGVAVANGTVALDLALKVLGIGPGDEVVVTPRTFIASASCIVNAGATPVFADVDADSQNITAETIRAVLTSRTRAIVCVHLAGWPCDMDPIMAIAAERGLYVIEDCAQAHGARYKGRSVGAIGHAAAWSFCQDKIMTTGGEGGMFTTNDESLWQAAWEYKDHGKSWETIHSGHHAPGFRWLHESFGTNWRMTELQAAVGRIQLAHLGEWKARRQENAKVLAEGLRGISGLRVVEPPSVVEHAYYKYYVFVRPERLRTGWDRDRIMNAIQAVGVPCFTGTCPEVYREKAFVSSGLAPQRRLPVAQELGKTSLMFLVHPTLTASHMVQVCEGVSTVMRNATAE